LESTSRSFDAESIPACAISARTPAFPADPNHLYPPLTNAGDVGTPDLWPLPLQQEAVTIYARHRIAGVAGLYARLQSRTGFTGALYFAHERGQRSYSAFDHAVFGALAEVTSLALS
jgi:hypothetical protein